MAEQGRPPQFFHQGAGEFNIGIGNDDNLGPLTNPFQKFESPVQGFHGGDNVGYVRQFQTVGIQNS